MIPQQVSGKGEWRAEGLTAFEAVVEFRHKVDEQPYFREGALEKEQGSPNVGRKAQSVKLRNTCLENRWKKRSFSFRNNSENMAGLRPLHSCSP